MHEVASQMERLRRQSKKAQVHRDLRGHILELDLGLASHDFARLQADTATTQAEADAVAAQLMLAGQAVGTLETDLETVRVRLIGAEEEIGQAGARRLEAQGAIQKAENELTLLGREAENLKRLKERYDEERRQLKARLVEQERQLDKARRQARESQDSLTGSREAAQRISEEVQERQEALSELEQRVDAAKHALVDHLSAISQQKNRLGDIERQQSELLRRQESLSSRRQTLEDDLARAEQDRQAAQEALEEERRQLEESEAALTQLSRQRDEYQQRLIGLRRAEQEATRRRLGLDASVKALGDALGSHDWAQAGVRRVLAEAAQGKLPAQVLGLVAEKLSVEPGAEALVEAALGPDLQAIIVPDGAAALALGDYVAQQNLGRIRVVALHELTGRLDHPAGSQPLAQLVRPEPGCQALAALWMNCGHSPDLGAAWTAAGQLEPGQVVVSAAGERLDRPGAASLGRGKAESVLTRQNELKRRREELLAAEEAQAEASQARDMAEGEVARLEEDHRDRRGQHQEQERGLRRREQDLFRLREAQGVKERQLEGLDYDAGEIWSELNRLENEGARLQETLAGLEGQSAQLEQGLSQSQEGLSQGRQDLERARTQEGEARLAVASLQNAAEQSYREAKRLGQEMEAASRAPAWPLAPTCKAPVTPWNRC